MDKPMIVNIVRQILDHTTVGSSRLLEESAVATTIASIISHAGNVFTIQVPTQLSVHAIQSSEDQLFTIGWCQFPESRWSTASQRR